ncbi:hypothetical protein FRC03_009370 [Tulasnella sp. 419]|nr:hypothetical protein FRC03_009370 [Tulasnella sp. 419]
MNISHKLVVLASYISVVLADGGITQWATNGIIYPGWLPYQPAMGQVNAARPYYSFNPILNPTDPTLHCNNNGESGPNQQSITVVAGGTITGYWSQWTDAVGAMTVWLAACSGVTCTGFSSANALWFKIHEVGLISGTVNDGDWASSVLMAKLKWSATVPNCLKPGPYLVRMEALTLHPASTPRFYPECAQLVITGIGASFPPNTYLTRIPGGWQPTDPGITIDIESEAAKSQTSYPIPGPPVWGCETTNISLSIPPSTSSSSPLSTSMPTASNPSSTSSAPEATQTPYGQCAGMGWTGPTKCPSSYQCILANAYYGQCLPPEMTLR